ncbi:unnamed protein product [Urochloa decumbens]|uniref:Uncharacterized protein n=1 Tax=Urochloa decumbens TaxID=240449 RepID=A0ABC9DNE6_9POAL
MEVTVTASHGPLRSLPAKLEALLLLLDGSKCMLLKGDKKRICRLKVELEQLISEYLMEPSDVGYPALSIAYWVNELTELAYDIDDCVDKLVHRHGDGSKITRICNKLREQLNPIRWLINDISEFRVRLKSAIQRHRDFHLDRWTLKTGILSDEHPPLLQPLVTKASGLVGLDSLVGMLSGWLAVNERGSLKVVAIAGIGGVGKTTLAKELYSKLRGQFECCAFVRASRKPDMKKLLTNLLLQVQPRQPMDAYEVPDLINKIRAHLRFRKYFIIVDDLWPSTWHIISDAFPDDDHDSKILITTEVDSLAQECCGHNSKYIFNMEPLADKESTELFLSRDFGHLVKHSEDLHEIIRECRGLPLATITAAGILASQPGRVEQWKEDHVHNSSSINWAINPELERMKLVLCLSYNAIPHRLKACMLYLCIYKEEYIILKDTLVKQWVAEGFVSADEGKDKEEVAGYYFDELVRRGMIQPVDMDHNDRVLSCTVHHLVLNLIRYKSMGDNFVTVLDHSQTDIAVAQKVRRLSLHYSNTEVAKPPSNMELSHVRSLAFFGLTKCMPPVANFKLLRVIILHLWPDHNEVIYDLTGISELFRLRVLQVSAYHLNVKLPKSVKHLKDLVTFEIEGRLAAVPHDIVNLPGLLHLNLPPETDLPDRIGCMISLRALRHFNLSRNSVENVKSLGELSNLRDLCLTCSRVVPYQLKPVMKCLSLVLGKLKNLRSLTLDHIPSRTNTIDGSASMHEISCELSSVSSPPPLLEKLELLPRIYIFSVLPSWIGELRKLSILKIEVAELSSNDVDTLNKLPSLTALSLFVRTALGGRIILDKEDFLGLKYFKFVCTTVCVVFLEGAMLNLQKLKLGFNAIKTDQCSLIEAGFKHLTGLKEISLKIGDAGSDGSTKRAIESVLAAAICKHSGSPVVNLKWVDWIFSVDKEKNMAVQKDTPLENQDVITEEGLDIHEMQCIFVEEKKKRVYSRCPLSPGCSLARFSLSGRLMHRSGSIRRRTPASRRRMHECNENNKREKNGFSCGVQALGCH